MEKNIDKKKNRPKSSFSDLCVLHDNKQPKEKDMKVRCVGGPEGVRTREGEG